LALSGKESAAQQQPSSAPPLRDPRTKYRKEPFAEQKQPWPALASKMDPPPDHGEQSYKGSGRLAGRKALVTGGDSGIGRAAAIAFAREGADVAINYFPTEEPDAKDVVELIKAAGRKAIALPADIRTQEACEKVVADAVGGLGGLDILVNNAAYQQSKKDISEITDEQLVRTFETNIFAPFRISKAAIPHLKPGSVIINRFGQFLRSRDRASGLRLYQRVHTHLHEGAGEAARRQRHPRQHGGARSHLDAAAGRGRPVAGRHGEVRPEHAAWPGRAAGRTGAPVRDVGVRRSQLHDGNGRWGQRGQGKPIESYQTYADVSCPRPSTGQARPDHAPPEKPLQCFATETAGIGGIEKRH
jgi:NAD(P)-dependent dehydrogenase (short-subunit alcohol dehydrogenase family)